MARATKGDKEEETWTWKCNKARWFVAVEKKRLDGGMQM